MGLGLVLLLAVFIALAAIRSADPSLYYQFTRRTAPPFTYPLLAVVACSCLMTGEAVAVWLTLTWGRAPVLARRLFWCFALLLWPALGSLLPRMHQPPYYYVHGLWIFTLALLALLGAAASHAAAVDVTDVVADIAAQATPVAAIGGAVLMVYAAVKAFKWARAAMS